MTDERNKSSGRPTARDVPFVRGAGMDSEPTPRGVRPAQLPRDPTYEAELAQVELAVLRDPTPRADPSTKQGGRLAQQSTLKPPPESITPESPVARHTPESPVARSPQPPGSGRSVASGTLLSVGGVDPRGKTERTLETPRMFISQHQGSEVYFKPGKIPAVTVHQTIETETVKLSDSIDPRRAKTIPRLDRAALAQLAELEPIPESEAPQPSLPRSSLDVSSARSPRWNQETWEAADEESLRSAHDGQIHASLSPFREQETQSFDLDGVPTRAEPLAARRSDAPEGPPSAVPDTSTVPTQRDLPAHRVASLLPPPAPSTPEPSFASSPQASEGPVATSASIAAEEPERRPVWINYAAFVAALLFAVSFGLYITREEAPAPVAPAAPPPVDTKPAEFDLIPTPPPLEAVPSAAPQAPASAAAASAPATPPVATPPVAVPAAAHADRPRAVTPRPASAPAQRKPSVVAPVDDAPAKPVIKTAPRETIF